MTSDLVTRIWGPTDSHVVSTLMSALMVAVDSSGQSVASRVPFVLLGRSFIVIYTIINDIDGGVAEGGGRRARKREGDLRRFGGYSCPEDYTRPL